MGSRLLKEYPQLRLMFVGMLISTLGVSMIWPFMMIYATERLGMPLSTTASLLTLNAICGVASSFTAGPLIDRLGRKWMMVFSLATNGLAYMLLGQATTLPIFALLMALSGAVNPIYRVATDAMLADLLPPEKRIDGYSLLRLANNVGIAMGPAIGGFIASTSYSLAFYCATAGMLTYSLLLTFFAAETLPAHNDDIQALPPREPLGGYLAVLRDTPFIQFVMSTFLVTLSAATIWTLLSVYTKSNYGISEQLYGFIPATNAFMVVTLQLLFTHHTKRFPQLPVIMAGAFLYATATGSIAFMSNFRGFWLSMVLMTFGELILVPTASTYAANLAPPDKRGRYMSIYGLTWSVAFGVGPLVGGLLNDHFGPRFIWYGGALFGYLSVLAFLLLYRKASRPDPILTTLA